MHDPKRRFSRSIYILPNLFTTASLFAGFFSIILAFSNRFDEAAWAILVSAVMDGLDGKVARLTHTASQFGIEYDSLADDVTFGFAPAAIVFNFMHQLAYPTYLGPIANLLPYAAFFIAVFSAVRLAKFNIDTRQTTSFIGLPTPANALFWASLVAGAGDWVLSLNAGWFFMLALIILSSYLLVSEIKMFSLKFKRLAWRANRRRYIFLLVALPMLSLGLVAAVPIIAWYVILSVYLSVKK